MSKEKLQQQFLYLFSLKRNLQVILFAATIIISQFSNAQNPGGVAGARLWLKANAGSNATEGTAPSTFWADQTANGRNATPFSSHGPLLRSTAINFNPAFRFTPTATGNSTDNTGSDAITIPEGTLNFSSSYLYLVGKRSDISQTYANRTGSYDIGASANYFNRAFSENNPGISSYDLYHIWRENGETANRSGAGASAGSVNKYVIINGQSPAALTDGLDIGRGDPTFHNLNGDIAEIIVFPTPTTANHLKILSYLALKYGITLDQTLPQNYVASDGSLAWDAGISGIFKNNIFGIGKDAASALDQRVANSVNAGQFVAISTSNDFVSSNPGARASLSDKNFLMLADDGGDISTWTSTGAPANKLIIGRQWQFQSAGTVGNIYVQVDRNALPGFYNPTDIFLLYDNTGSGDYSTIIPTVSVSQTGSKYVFKLPAFIDGGARFTIASNKPACGITPAFTGTDSTVFAGSTLSIAANQAGNWISASPANATVAVGNPSSNAIISGIIGSTTSLLSFIPTDPLCSTITRTIIIKDMVIPPCTTPAIPAGPNSVTVGAADITLTSDQAGIWSITSGNSFASLNNATSTTVNVHGVALGTATITFTPTCGGAAQAVTKDVIVNCTAPAIPTGPGSVTIGADISLTSDQPGTWSITSGNSFATLNSATSTTVNVHGVSPGTATITFTPNCGGAAQAVTKDVIVNCTAPAVPVGSGSVTVGSADITLTSDQAGIWAITLGGSFATLNNATSTTVNVHGIASGTATITFTPDCGGSAQAVTKDVIVNCTAPAIPTGPGSVRVGIIDIILTADQPGAWAITAGNSFATLYGATATTVNLHGVSPGTATITFTPDCGGAAQAVTKDVIVNCTAPAVPTGPGSVIVGIIDIILTADQPGTWSITSGNSFAILYGATATTVNLHGVSPGTATVTFTPDCGGAAQAVTKNIVVNCAAPVVPAGPGSVTVGSADITLTADQAGTWTITSGNSFATLNNATATTVNVHGIAPGIATITFTPDCGGVAQAVTKDVLVNCTAPAVPVGPGSVRVGIIDIILTSDQPGTWAITAGNSFATLYGATSTTVNLHGVSPGTATVTFTPDCGGAAQAVTKDIVVNCTAPVVPAGPGSVTVGSADITLTSDQAGIWSITSGNSFASLNNATSTTVSVHGVSPGTATITFTPDCGGAAQAVTKDINVSIICINPTVPAGPGAVTVGTSDITLTADQSGTWTIISGSSFATLNSATSTTVKVHGIAPGTATITFTPDCGGAAQAVTKDIVVNCTAPAIPAGPGSVTVGGADVTLTADQSGVWAITSGNSHAVLINATSTTVNIHGITPGTATITFTPDCGGLLQAIIRDVLVNCIAPGIPAGAGSITVGDTDATLTADQPGVWSISSGNSFVTLNGATSTTVNVHGIAPGAAIITFTPDCGGAAQAINKNIVVNCTAPGIPAGPGSVITGGADITLTADQAGSWTITSGNSFVTLNGVTSTSVNVHAIAAGTATITFTPDCGGAAEAVTKNIDVSISCVTPGIPTGPSSVTIGDADITLTADQAGVWSIIAGSSFATLDAVTSTTVNVHALSAGSVTVSFTPACGGVAQAVTKSINVNPAGIVCALAPEFVTAPSSVFVGASVPISANQPGLWSSGTASASITPVVAASNAIITGVSAGSTVISFSPSDAACPTIAKIVTVNLASTGPIRLVVFPNPVTDQLSIRADTDELKSVKIFSSNGQDLTPMVRKISEANNTVVLDVSKLPPGTYNIKTATSNTKIIKQ